MLKSNNTYFMSVIPNKHPPSQRHLGKKATGHLSFREQAPPTFCYIGYIIFNMVHLTNFASEFCMFYPLTPQSLNFAAQGID